ncbi:MAG: hypothetical protein AAGG11_03295 [Pseudomonadota bacterium]
MSASNPPKDDPSDDSKALLGDLQRIRSLLDEDQEPDDRLASSDEVPLLDDPVAEPQPEGGLNADSLDRLLGDDWKDEADEVLKEARLSIDAAATGWTPEDTDALNEALRVRIDDTIQIWLEQLLSERIGELRTRVLAAMADEIQLRVKEPLADVEPTNLLDAITRKAQRKAQKDQDGS